MLFWSRPAGQSSKSLVYLLTEGLLSYVTGKRCWEKKMEQSLGWFRAESFSFLCQEVGPLLKLCATMSFHICLDTDVKGNEML